jgi:hypothetical protein
VRLAANLAIDRQTINQAETLGFSKLTASMIPQSFEATGQRRFTRMVLNGQSSS